MACAGIEALLPASDTRVELAGVAELVALVNRCRTALAVVLVTSTGNLTACVGRAGWCGGSACWRNRRGR